MVLLSYMRSHLQLFPGLVWNMVFGNRNYLLAREIFGQTSYIFIWQLILHGEVSVTQNCLWFAVKIGDALNMLKILLRFSRLILRGASIRSIAFHLHAIGNLKDLLLQQINILLRPRQIIHQNGIHIFLEQYLLLEILGRIIELIFIKSFALKLDYLLECAYFIKVLVIQTVQLLYLCLHLVLISSSSSLHWILDAIQFSF